MFALTKELTELTGPVGQEQIVQDRMAELWTTLGLTVTRSKINNVFGEVGTQGPRAAARRARQAPPPEWPG